MINDLVIEDGHLDNKVIEELYNEAFKLSGLVVEYFQENKKETLAQLNVDLMSSYTLECNRITTGIMQAMS